MKILFTSYVFTPSIGGIEQVGLELAKRMVQRGHSVTVVTETPGPDQIDGIQIVRNPQSEQLWDLYAQSDAVFGNHLSLRLLRPLLLRPRMPHCILLHTHLPQRLSHRLLSHLLLRRGKCYAVSKALAQAHNLSEKVIYNGYDRVSFHPGEVGECQCDFLFVGRLVSDKGIDLLVDAMRQFPVSCRCIVVGDGPDRESFEARAPSNMSFLGRLDSQSIADLMRQSKWLVVPSRWEEPFGLVVIEAIACGAGVIAANHGGLPEAVGPCGLLFQPNDIQSLTMTMRKVLEQDDGTRFSEQERKNHLAQFSYDQQVDRILQVLHQ